MKKKKNSSDARGFKISSEVEDFINLSMKKYKKLYGDPYASKKDIKKGYYRYLLDLFPKVIDLLIRWSNVKEVKDLTPAIYERMSDEDFIKCMKKAIEEDGADAFENAQYLPIVIQMFLKNATEWEKKLNEESDKTVHIEVNDLVDLSTEILKKKIKKLKKAGVDEAIAFDCLSVIPDTDILKKGAAYRIRQFMYVLYEHAKTKEINFSVLADKVITEEFYPVFIVSLLLEKKEMYVQFTEEQKKFFNSVTDWVFNTMEGTDGKDGMDKDTIKEILKSYVCARKRDSEQNKDSNRRYFLSSLPETEFPRVMKVMKKMISEDESIKDFL